MEKDLEQEEVKSISGNVLAFGLAAVTLLVVVICGCLLIALYSMSSRYLDQTAISQDRKDVIYTLQRALDRAEGRLSVYEEFLVDRREEIVQKLIVKYLRKEKTKSTDATLNDFEQWIGLGGR